MNSVIIFKLESTISLSKETCQCFTSTLGVSLIHITIFSAPPWHSTQTDRLAKAASHCACMPISDLTRWQLPNTMTLLYPSSCFSERSWQASTCALRLPKVHANPCAVICHFQWGTVCLLRILIGFLVKLMVWGGTGLPLWPQTDSKQQI